MNCSVSASNDRQPTSGVLTSPVASPPMKGNNMIKLHSIRAVMTTYVIALTNSPVQFGVWVMASWFTINGPAAYLIYPGMFSSMTPRTTIILGFIPVTLNLCHMLCHFISGLIGLVAVYRRSWAIAYALIGGTYYIAWGFVGLLGGAMVRHHLGVDVFGSWVHVVEGVALYLIWIANRRIGRRRVEPAAVLPQTSSAAAE